MTNSKSRSGTRRPLPSKRRGARDSAGNLDLIGMDMAPRRGRQRNRTAIPAILAVVAAALAMVGVRNNLTWMRYEAAEALRLEQSLRDEKLAVTVEKRKLLDPRLLAREAQTRGFVHPERVVDLARVRPREHSRMTTGRRP